MAEAKTTIYYNHNFYYDFSKIISADDRGLQFGDGCYEWIRVFQGHPFALSYHVDRLYRSMRLLGIRPVTALMNSRKSWKWLSKKQELQKDM